jgi:tetratricopeptide (TPR) repeat protein
VVRGDWVAARRLAERYLDAAPQDAGGWLILGRAWLGGDSASRTERLNALRHCRRAAQLDSLLLDAWDCVATAALHTGEESAARDALEELLWFEPRYPRAWERWLLLYRNDRNRAGVRTILRRHAADPVVRSWIARMFIEEERYDSSSAVLNELVALEPWNGAWLALRAQSAFEAGDTAAGHRFYERALEHAEVGGDLLWGQVVGIATPDEVRAWPHVPVPERGDFLRRFWARRNPDLFAARNARIPEHFRRLRIARRQYALLEPLAERNRTAAGRGFDASPSNAEQMFYQRCEARPMPSAPVRIRDQARDGSAELGGMRWNPLYRASDHQNIQPPGVLYLDPEVTRLLSMPYAADFRDVDTAVAPVGYNLLTGLDDRGLALLRFGEPRRRIVGSDNVEDPFCRIRDLERWTYDGVGEIRFFRPSAVSVGVQGSTRRSGDVVFRPMVTEQLRATVTTLTRDATSEPAPLEFGFWVVQFAARSGATVLVVVTTRGAAAAALVGPMSDTVHSVGADGVVRVQAPGGLHTLLVHAREGDSLGRRTVALHLRRFEGLAASDLLLARAWSDRPPTRDLMLARLGRTLTFPPGTVLRSYAELYGVPPRGGRVRYRALYRLRRTDDPAADARRDSLPGALALAFDRDAAGESEPVREWLDITPEQLPPGSYLLRLDTWTPDGRRIGRSQIAFTVADR